ncbi:MAG: hypothetical protein ACTH6N_08605 [Brachybacterium tyrofermentans]|uniref:hypothetical protein n=1 Tax=Brachybacterium tyrofermentans TaxID=47848 RepID=UPI001868E95F|nr:hypothetical protein [Brachybacterium tyrofermentans]
MKRTFRLLAAPAAAMLLLASCGTTDEPAPAEDTVAQDEAQADAEPSDAGGEEKSSAEIQAEHAEENPDGLPMDDGGDDTEGSGNVDSVEFDGVTLDLDVDALANAEVPTNGRFYLAGATGVVAIAEVGAEGPEDLERLRQGTDSDPVTYIKVDVDNRSGSEEIGMYEWSMYDAAGQEYPFQSAQAAKVEWGEAIDADDDGIVDSDEMQEMYDLSGEIDYPNAAPMQRNVQWLVGPADLPDEVVGMAATAEGFADTFAPFPVK